MIILDEGDALGEREGGAVVDGHGRAAHVELPRVAATLAAPPRLLVAAKRTYREKEIIIKKMRMI